MPSDKSVAVGGGSAVHQIGPLQNGVLAKFVFDAQHSLLESSFSGQLRRLTPLEDAFSCNFNVLIGGMPQVLGVRRILEEWTAWRTESVRRRVFFVLGKRREKLHLLKGLKRILLDIDKAIRIIRETEEESEVIPNLMIGFGIDQVQAEYVAEIRLRNINKEYILKRVKETEALQDEIDDLEDILRDPRRVKKIILEELRDAAKKYGEPRRTAIIYAHELPDPGEDEGPEEVLRDLTGREIARLLTRLAEDDREAERPSVPPAENPTFDAARFEALKER